jgi:hypothetical protein
MSLSRYDAVIKAHWSNASRPLIASKCPCSHNIKSNNEHIFHCITCKKYGNTTFSIIPHHRNKFHRKKPVAKLKFSTIKSLPKTLSDDKMNKEYIVFNMRKWYADKNSNGRIKENVS